MPFGQASRIFGESVARASARRIPGSASMEPKPLTLDQAGTRHDNEELAQAEVMVVEQAVWICRGRTQRLPSFDHLVGAFT